VTAPEFVDNRNGNTLAGALNARLQHLAATLRQPVDVAIATGYFNPEGFARVAPALRQAGKIRLLLGAEPTPPPARPIRHLGDPRGNRFEARLTQEALRLNEQGLLRDRDHLAFSPATDGAIRQLLDFLKSGRIEVRRYERQFLHGKAYLFSAGNGVIAGSSNFTAAGLSTNLELNLGQYQPSVVGQVERWFEDLWAEAVPYDLAAIYDARFAEYQPYLIYLRVLWERYGKELASEATATGKIHLTRFQNDGLDRARRILQRYNGVLIADSVGLGKTFLAGELLAESIERKRQRALLIAPAALRDGTWARFRSRFQLGVEVKSFEQVAQGSLEAKPEEYSLIIIDEAHAYRHADTTRAQALRKLLRGDPPKQIVLMTATPVNNSLWDLYELLGYFVGHDAVFADLGIPSLKRRFEQAAKHDPFTLKPDVLFDVLDATTVRRTRHFVQRFYPHDRIELKDGTKVTIQFPRPHVKARTYDLDHVLPGFFQEFAAILQPENGEPLLSMARYWPSRYRRGGGPDAREVALVGLIRSGLLKRFESSARAFANTLAKMIRAHDHFLEAMERGVIPAPEALTQLEETDSDEAWEEVLTEGTPLVATEVDTQRLRAAVAADRELLDRLYQSVLRVTPYNDPKLQLVVDELVEALQHAERTSVGEQDVRNRRKVLIFSYFADTVEWIAEFLREKLATDHRLAPYRGRLAVVRGTEGYEDVGRRQAVYGFAPISTEAPPGFDADRFDILITTDVLAEGMNLQQAARIINYDLPWNPMRLVQRHGRIDRIGSPHRDVFMTCIFPDRALESLLALEERIRRKLAQAAASVGLDQEVIPGVEGTEQVFADTLEEIERIQKGDATLFETAGEDARAHSGEEYRQELRKALERYDQEIKALPGAAGSGLRLGAERGHFFCARVDDRVFLRFVPWGEGSAIARDSLACLRRITCEEGTKRVLPQDLAEGAYSAWERARRDIFDEWQKAADPRNLQPDIRPLFKAAAAHVRGHIPPDMSREDADRVVEALEAPWGLRVEKALRSVFTPETAAGDATTRKIAEQVKILGLQPWKAPEPLPPIEEEDVVLVVWMAVESERATG
jgi:superfamily II DNA or RNA helicase